MRINRHALRVLRQRSGLSVSALARQAGVSQPHLSNIELGHRQASPEVVRRLALALRVPLVALLADPDDEPEPRPVAPAAAAPRPLDVAGATGCRPNSKGDPMHRPAPIPPDPPTPPPVGSRAVPAVPSPLSDVQLPGTPPADRRERAGRRVGRAVAGLASAGAVLSMAVPAHAETYYTGQCTVSQTEFNVVYYRSFQARISADIEQGTGKYIWRMYDYKYWVDLHLSNGGASDEEVTFTSGYSDGLSNPWHSPDNHGTSGDWIQEANWKNAKSYWGFTKVKFYAAFDVPGTPDPHCTTYTATV